MACVIMSCFEFDIESLSAVHDTPFTVRKSPYLAGYLAGTQKIEGCDAHAC